MILSTWMENDQTLYSQYCLAIAFSLQTLPLLLKLEAFCLHLPQSCLSQANIWEWGVEITKSMYFPELQIYYFHWKLSTAKKYNFILLNHHRHLVKSSQNLTNTFFSKNWMDFWSWIIWGLSPIEHVPAFRTRQYNPEDTTRTSTYRQGCTSQGGTS